MERATAKHPPPHLAGAVAVASVGAFVVLGLPDGMLGVAWPVLRHRFNEPLAALGELLMAALVGYLLTTTLVGRALRRLSTGRTLFFSSVLATCAVAGFVFSTWWVGLVVAALGLGAAGGGVDAALNTAVALSGQPRLMNVLHSAYGVGAALGPLMITAAVALSTWRTGYAVVLVAEVALVGCWWRLGPRFPPLGVAHREDRPAPPAHRRSLDRRLLRSALAVFFVYTGVEVAVGAWSASFLRGAGGLSATVAGVAVFAYWAGLALGRLATAGVGHRLSPEAVVRLGTSTVVLAAALVWARPSEAVAVGALAVLGMGLGPVFPALVTLTPRRLGETLALDAVGFELAAAGIGGAGLSAAVGLVLQLAGLGAFGPSVVVLAAAAFVVNLRLERLAKGRGSVVGWPGGQLVSRPKRAM